MESSLDESDLSEALECLAEIYSISLNNLKAPEKGQVMEGLISGIGVLLNS